MKPSLIGRLFGRGAQSSQQQLSILASARLVDSGQDGVATWRIGNNYSHNHKQNHNHGSSSHSKIAGLFSSSQANLKHVDNQDQKAEHTTDTPHRGIFGVPLRESIAYANVAISLVDEQGDSYIYGYVPIVVAKCGVFLKEKGMALPSVPSAAPSHAFVNVAN